MLASNIYDRTISELGSWFAPNIVNQCIMDVARDFCRYSMILNEQVNADVSATDVVQTSNYSANIAIPSKAECEPSGIFGLKINETGFSSVERKIITTAGAQPVYASGTMFYFFDGLSAVNINPVPAGGNITASIAYIPVAAATQISDDVWNDYSEGLLSGIKARLTMMPNYSSYNPQLSTVFSDQYARSKRIARAIVASSLIGNAL